MLTNKELIKLGINPEDLSYMCGEMNIIVGCYGLNDEDVTKKKENDEDVEIFPNIYQPRKNRVYSCSCENDGISLTEEFEKQDYIAHLKDSAARLKIMAYYLEKQIEEIEKFGYPKTDLYFPE